MLVNSSRVLEQLLDFAAPTPWKASPGSLPQADPGRAPRRAAKAEGACTQRALTLRRTLRLRGVRYAGRWGRFLPYPLLAYRYEVITPRVVWALLPADQDYIFSKPPEYFGLGFPPTLDINRHHLFPSATSLSSSFFLCTPVLLI